MKKTVRVLEMTLVLCILTAFFAPYMEPVQNAQGATLKITLDPGHGGTDPGTDAALSNGGSHYESWYNLEITKAAKERLEKYGVTVYMTRTADTDVSLSDRVDIAVNNGSDALISIHNNSVGISSAHGSVICVPTENYRPAMGKKSAAIANNILSELAVSPGTKNRGLLKESYNGLYYPDGSASDYYAINRYAKQRGLSASMIVECGFCTNTGDVAILESVNGRKQIGYSIANGIAEYYGLEIVEDKPVVPKYKANIKAATAGGKVGFNEDYSITALSDLTDGSVISFKVKADSGYKCSEIKVGNQNLTIQGNGTGAFSYQTKVSAKDVSISVSFTKILYNLGVYRVTTDFLNVREQPNANSDTKILGVFNSDDRFTVTEIVNTHWGKVVYNGGVGYISIHLNYAEHVSDLIIESNDIVFDHEESVKWVNGGSSEKTNVSLYTDQTTEDISMKLESSTDKPRVDFRFDKLGSMYADSYRYIVFTAKTFGSGTAKFSIYTKENATAINKEIKCVDDGLWHNYIIDLSDSSGWSGEVKNILFEYLNKTESDNVVFIRNIRFFTSKPQSPEVTLSDSSMELSGNVTVKYRGIGDYYQSNDNILPFIAVYSDNSDYLGEPLFKKYLTDASGSFDFSAESTEGKIDIGNYIVRLGYDAKGTNGKNINLHTVFFYSDASLKKFTVEKTVRFESGLYQVYIPRVPTGVVLMRVNPSDNSVVKAAIPTGTKVHVSTVSEEWGYVSFNGVEGWVNIVKNMNYISDNFVQNENVKIPVGDVNGDASVNVADVVALMMYKRGVGGIPEEKLIASSVYKSGEQITVLTLVTVYRCIIG